MIFHVLTPATCAAMTNSSFLREMNLPLTVLASPVHEMKEIITVMYRYMRGTGMSAGIAADNAIQSGIVGSAVSTSIILWITVSTTPPK